MYLRVVRYFFPFFVCISSIPTIAYATNNHLDFSARLIEEPARNLIVISGDNKGVPLEVSLPFVIDGEEKIIDFKGGRASITYRKSGSRMIFIANKENKYYRLFYLNISVQGTELINIPLWVSILPPLIAIILALIFKEVILSIFIGLLAGAFILNGLQIDRIFIALFSIIDTYILEALLDKGHLSIIVFSLMIGAMVNIISKNGGMSGVVRQLSKYANSVRNAQLVTWFIGVLIFFDDYANTLIVGNSMRPVTDKFKISREKLAYIVDSTAAPMAAIAFVTTWIGAELGYVQEAISTLPVNHSAYAIFLNSLQFAFYPVLTIIFILLIILLKRDFGPMYYIEKKTRIRNIDDGQIKLFKEEQFAAINRKDEKWINGLLPVVILTTVTIIGLIYSGYDKSIWLNGELSFINKLSQTIGQADAFMALLWGALSGLVVAVVLSVSQGLISNNKIVEYVLDGFKTMLAAIVILVLAWALSGQVKELHVGDYFLSILPEGLSPSWMPIVIFILSAGISFATGSSWGTMAILYPFIIPVVWYLCQQSYWSYQESITMLSHAVAVVLGGSVFGDHCSPISDTTILSSMASDCDHITHVRTQLPYAVVVAVVGLLMSIIAIYFNFHWLLNYLIGSVMLFIIILVLGKKIGNKIS